MAKAVADGRVSGMITLLARHGQVVSEKIYGARRLEGNVPMTRDTIFRLYSMTKPITGVAMMILFEEGKWRLDDPVTRFVPEFKELKVFTGTDAAGQLTVEPMKRPPTMREIMSHSGRVRLRARRPASGRQDVSRKRTCSAPTVSRT